MLKVMAVKVLSEYRAIINKREEMRKRIEEATRTFASNLGYDEEHADALISFVQGNDAPDGLTDAERVKLEILSEFLVEVPDEGSADANVGTSEA